MNILVIDLGGTQVKVLASGQTEPRRADSGKDLTPAAMIETVRGLTDDWGYEAVSLGYPGLCGDSGPRSEPGNLGSLTTTIGKQGGNISNLKITNRSVDFFEILIDIQVADVKHLSNIIAALRATPVINSVERARG